MVVLPDHLHCLWTLPADDRDFSTRWRLIKTTFTRQCAVRHKSPSSPARLVKKEQAVWQWRFGEHKIRDEGDLRRHVEYIHYNPAKHGLVAAPRDWPHSSFHWHVVKGSYDADWGASGPIHFADTVGNE
jgi:putative transposase